MKTCILGLGVSGRAAAKFCLSLGDEVYAWDQKPVVAPQGVTFIKEVNFSEYERIVYSPGMPLTHPLLVKAFASDAVVVSEIELGLQNFTGIAVGITGTNGKTTVTELIAHVLRCSGLKADAVGNNGTAFTEWMIERPEDSIAVCELSSYQLETLNYDNFKCGILLNISEDHLDRYGSMHVYLQAKLRLALCSSKFYTHPSVDNALSYYGVAGELGLKKPFTFEDENLLAAYTVLKELGVNASIFQEAVATFKKPAHRLEFVCEKEGIKFYNDSKGTNVDAVIRAVDSFNAPIILIAGGVDKGGSYLPWQKKFQGKVRACVLIGEAKIRIAGALENVCPCYPVETLEDAVKQARVIASPGEIVLLSPGCSSFDMFVNFVERGNQFVQLI